MKSDVLNCRHLWPVTSAVSRYGLAVVLVTFAFGLTLVLQHFEASRPTLFLFFAAVAAAAWFGGVGPSYLAVVMAVPAGIYFYTGPFQSFSLTLDNAVMFVFFVACATVGGVLSSRQRDSELRLQRTHDQLQVRAAELHATNEALVAEISDRKRAERALQDVQAEFARVMRLTTMGELTASIAHEINQPLAAVVTNGSVCLRSLELDQPDFDEARQAARRIIRDGNRASEVIGRIRAMLKKAPPERIPLSIASTIQDVLALTRSELDKQHIRVFSELPSDLPPVLGDRVQLQQVFLNLVMNSVEAMLTTISRPRHLSIKARMEPDRSILVTIEDSGVGLDTSTIDKLFDAFFTTKPQGMGLGLSICRTIVSAHGGQLSAAPAFPFGAAFQITLPSMMAN